MLKTELEMACETFPCKCVIFVAYCVVGYLVYDINGAIAGAAAGTVDTVSGIMTARYGSLAPITSAILLTG